MKTYLLIIALLISNTAAFAMEEEEVIVSGFRQTLLESINANRTYWEEIPLIEEEEVIVTSSCFGSTREYPIFYEAASLSFNQDLLTGMMLYAINNPDECEDYEIEWYCSEFDFSDTRAFVGIDKNGDEMPIGFVCKLYGDTPDQRYYESETLEEHGCARVDIEENEEPDVYYPHDF